MISELPFELKANLKIREEIERAEFWVEYYLQRHPMGYILQYANELSPSRSLLTP
jgi:hypothetical protein